MSDASESKRLGCEDGIKGREGPSRPDDAPRGSSSGTPSGRSTPSRRASLGLVGLAYATAVASIFPSGGALLWCGLIFARYGEHSGDRFAQWGPPMLFSWISAYRWEWCEVAAASAALAGLAIVLARLSDSTPRLAACVRRLAFVGLALAIFVALTVGAVTIYAGF